MTRVWDAAGALLAGAVLASGTALDAAGADAAAALHARWRPERAPTDVALVAIDAHALRHAEFASRPQAQRVISGCAAPYTRGTLCG